MRIIKYETFWAMVDAIDLYIGDEFTRRKYKGIMGDVFHFPRLRFEYNANPTIAINAMILLHWQQDGDLMACIRPNEWVRVNSETSLESILAIVKSKYKPRG